MEPSSDQNNDEERPEEEQVDFNRPNFIFMPKEYHEWRQQGPYVVCKSCELQHAVYIGTEQIMYGIDKEGKPILRAR